MALACSTSIRVTKNTQLHAPPHIFYGSRDRIKVTRLVNCNWKHSQQCIPMVIPSPLYRHPSTKRSSVPERGFSRSAHSTRYGLGGEEEHTTATGAIHKLYTAIKNQDFRELSEVIGEECRMVLNFMSLAHGFYGREHVMEFFSWLMSSMGKKIHFVIYPMAHGGPEVGLVWQLDWKESFIPMGKGHGFHITHHYKGNMTIGDMKIFIEPLKHFGPLQSKLVETFMPLIAKVPLTSEGKKQKALTYGLLSLFVFTISCLLMGNSAS